MERLERDCKRELTYGRNKRKQEERKMYAPTVNKRYFYLKRKREKENRIREKYQEGKSLYEISEEEHISEFELRKILGLE